MSYGKFQDEAARLDTSVIPGYIKGAGRKSTMIRFAFLRDIWIKNKRYSELFAFIHENWDNGQWDDFFEPLVKHLLENKLEKQFVKFWKGLIRHRLETLWDWKKEYGRKTDYWDGTQKTIESQQNVLEALNKFKEGLEYLVAEEEIVKVNNLIETVNRLEKPKPKKTTDKRKIDEDLFWELIENNRQISEDKYDFIDKLSSKLEEFKPLEIKRFEKTFQTKFEELNHWDVWALAYISRNGCGDDAFDYFKAWAISKGKKAFEAIKELKIFELKEYFDEEPQLEEMLYMAENVYENKTEELMPTVKVKLQKMLGNEWEENNIKADYPELCKLFEYES